MKAIKIKFPDADIRFCSFHVGQAWRRKLEQLGLKQCFLNINSEKGKLLRRIFGLKALDEDLVAPCFYEYFSNSNKPARLRKIFDYLEKFYIKPNCKFPIHSWANVTSMGIECTTNGAESYHSLFTFPRDKPNIFLFLEKLKKTERDAERKARSTNIRKNKTVKHHDLLASLRSKSISFKEFLDVAAPAMARIS